jgi:LysM repeat protein
MNLENTRIGLVRQWEKVHTFLLDIKVFVTYVHAYTRRRLYRWFQRFETVKDALVDILYQKRGRYVRPFLHLGTIGLSFAMITLGPLVLAQADESEAQQVQGVLSVGATTSFATQQATEVRQFRGGEIITHVVSDGETLSSIAQRYGLQVSTLLWENKLNERSPIRSGMELRILPIDGVRHQVARGESIFTIARRYGLDVSQAQVIVDYPFNEFLNDETFALATGQFVMVPDGVMPAPQAPAVTRPAVPVAQLTPTAGSVTAAGSFVWPAAGRITQGYRFYHKAIDIANRAGGPILTADSGTVTAAGWANGGYGIHVVVDHGNGFQTLYAHLSVLQVSVGQTVNRGDVLGQMGNTGRSTGTHLHFEIRQGGVFHDPMQYL